MEQDLESFVMNTANQFFSSKFDSVQLLEFFKFLGCAMNLDSFTELTRQKKQKSFFSTTASPTPTNQILQNFPFMGPLTIYYERTTLLRRSIETMKKRSAEHWRRNLPWPNVTSLKYHLMEPKTIAQVKGKVWGNVKKAEFQKFSTVVQQRRRCPVFNG